MKAVVAAFNQEKALVGAFSVITNHRMELFEALVKIWWWCIPEQCQFWWQITDQSSNHLHSSHPHCSKAAPCLAHLHQWFKLHPVIIQNTPSNIFHNKIFLFCCCFEHLSLSQQQLPTNFYLPSLWSLWSKGDGQLRRLRLGFFNLEQYSTNAFFFTDIQVVSKQLFSKNP